MNSCLGCIIFSSIICTILSINCFTATSTHKDASLPDNFEETNCTDCEYCATAWVEDGSTKSKVWDCGCAEVNKYNFEINCTQSGSEEVAIDFAGYKFRADVTCCDLNFCNSAQLLSSLTTISVFIIVTCAYINFMHLLYT